MVPVKVWEVRQAGICKVRKLESPNVGCFSKDSTATQGTNYPHHCHSTIHVSVCQFYFAVCGYHCSEMSRIQINIEKMLSQFSCICDWFEHIVHVHVWTTLVTRTCCSLLNLSAAFNTADHSIFLMSRSVILPVKMWCTTRVSSWFPSHFISTLNTLELYTMVQSSLSQIPMWNSYSLKYILNYFITLKIQLTYNTDRHMAFQAA